MPYTRTLAELRKSVAIRGSYEGSEDITEDVLNEVICDALEESYNICIASDDDYYVKLGTQFSVVAGQDTYAVPGDFLHLRKVELLLANGRWIKLFPISVDGANSLRPYGVNARRYRYRLSAQGLTLSPVPATSTDIVRIYYIPLAPQPDSDSFQVTFDRPVEQKLVLHIALRDLLDRQNLETAPMDRKVEILSAQLRTNADSHDEGEPMMLSDHNSDDEDYC